MQTNQTIILQNNGTLYPSLNKSLKPWFETKTGLKPKLSRNIKWRLSFGFKPSLNQTYC